MKERRLFRRHNHDLRMTVSIKDSPFSAKVVDYSADGLGLTVEDHPAVEKGDALRVDIDRPRIGRSAIVMWAKSLPSVTRLGLHLGRPIEGSLDDFSVADILLGLQRSLKTGVLDIQSGHVVKRIYLSDGDIVFAASNSQEDGFTALLLRNGRLTEDHYGMILALQKKTGKKQGTLLVETGLLKPQELAGLLKLRVEETILGAFSFENGEFRFSEGPLPSNEALSLKLSAANIIYRGFRSINDIHRLRKECPADDAIIGLSSDPLDLFQDLKLAKEDKKILSLIDGNRTMKDIIGMSPTGELDTLRALSALFGTRMIEVRETPSADNATLEEVLGETKVDSRELLGRIDEIYETLPNSNFFDFLGVTSSSSDEEVKKAYYRMAKEFHPDVHYNLAADVNLKLSVIFSQISTAYAALKSREGRERYSRTLSGTPLPTSGKRAAKRKYEEGLKALESGAVHKAETLFGEAAYLDDSKAEYHYHYGYVLLRLDKHKDAERELKKAFAKDPKNPDILAELGHVYIKLGFPTRAKGNFERALTFKSTHRRALQGLKLLKEAAEK